jgi:serine/threonine-protein kinase HipA
MTARKLEVRLEQFLEPVGYLSSTNEGGTSYSYSEQYLGDPKKVPISIALPLKPEQFDDIETRAFFDNLLPENDQLQQVMEREGLARTDTVGLLSHLGADCPGAISCIPDGEGPVKVPGNIPNDYDLLRDEDIKDIVRRLADREPLPNAMRDPSPLAGVQRKIALAQFQDGRFGVPKSGLRVPTTHILKVPRRTKGREALLETAAALLCRAATLDVVIPTVLNIDGLAAVLVPRFDRQIGSDGTVRRIHQEDFAQALSLPAGLKYERYGKEEGRRFDVRSIVKLLDLTAEPAAAKHDFLVATIFNLVIGNRDNHAKNHALLYDKGPVPRLAPLYDLLPTRLDNTLTEDFSFKIGNAERSNSLTQVDIMSFFSSFGLSKAAAERFISDTIAPLLGQIDKASESLTAQGLKELDDLIGSEAQRLIEVLRLKVSIRDRDYFAHGAAGGWKLGS